LVFSAEWLSLIDSPGLAQIAMTRPNGPVDAQPPCTGLSSLLGYDSTRAPTLLHAPSQMWSFGSTAVLTLFDGGRLSAQSFQARAAFDQQVANYRNRVLTAYQEVEDNLAALRSCSRKASPRQRR
jgi:outer membrane protein TolC